MFLYIAAVISIESAGLLNIADLYLTLASLSIAGILKVASWAMLMYVWVCRRVLNGRKERESKWATSGWMSGVSECLSTWLWQKGPPVRYRQGKVYRWGEGQERCSVLVLGYTPSMLYWLPWCDAAEEDGISFTLMIDFFPPRTHSRHALHSAFLCQHVRYLLATPTSITHLTLSNSNAISPSHRIYRLSDAHQGRA